MHKKLIPFLIVVFLLMGTTFSYADVLTFGGDDNRQHLVTEEVFPVLEYMFSANVGTSQSQPLIIGPDKTPDKKSRIYSMAGDKLWALNAEEKQMLWSKSVNGGQGVSGSHTTYFEGLLYSGTADGRIVVHDQNGNKINGISIGTRVVSAPLVMKWNGHTLVIAGSNNGKAYIIRDPQEGNKIVAVTVGGVLTSSPVPIGNEGFLIASDGADGKVAAIYFSDLYKIQGNDLIPKNNSTPRWKKTLPAGIPASFSVSENYAYFMTKRGHLFKLNMNSSKATGNDQFAAASTFSNHSPAVDEKYVYYPVNSLNGGNGAVIILEKNTMQLVKVLNLTGKLTTAPLIWQKAKALTVGQSGGYLAIFEIGGTWQKQAIKLTGVKDMPTSITLSGVTSEISVADNKLVVGVNGSSFSGLMVFSMLKPSDLAVEKIDPGVLPKDIKPGAIYTGQVTFKNNSYVTTTINNNSILTINNNKTALYDENNNKITDLKLAAGEEKTLKFTWKAPNTKEIKFVATINLPPAFWETNYNNNTKTLTLNPGQAVTPSKNNLKVKILEYPKTSYEGQLTSIKARITNEAGELISTKLLWKVNGKVINKKDSLNIVNARDEVFSFKMPSGAATVTVEVNPEKNKPAAEINWSDNKDTCSIGLAVPEEKETKGKYTLSISAPNLVNANTAFNYSVSSGYTGTKRVRSGTDANGKPKYKTVKVIKDVKLVVTADYLKTVRYQTWNDYMENKQYTDTFNNSYSIGNKTISYKNNGAFVINNQTAVIITAKLYEGNTLVAKQSKMVNVNPLTYEQYIQLSQ